MNTSRIMYITPFYHPMYAASITTHEVVSGLAEKGHHVDLLTPSGCFNSCVKDCPLECDEQKSIDVHRISLLDFPSPEKHLGTRLLVSTIFFLPLIIYALVIGRKNKPDLVMCTYHVWHLAPLSALIVSSVEKVPLVIKCHDVVVYSEGRRGVLGRVFNFFLSHLNSVALKRAKVILALSSEMKLLIMKMYQMGGEKIIVFPNGVNTQIFKDGIICAKVREELKVKNRKTLLYIGRLAQLYRRKGLEFLIEVMPKVVSKEPRVILIIVGLVSEKVKEELRSLASSLKVENHVKFVNRVPYCDIPRYISVADICVGPLYPSLYTYGSVPRKVLEYIACAKPVIACQGGVSSDLIIDGSNGLLVSHGDYEKLASRVLELLENPGWARRMGLNGRHDALNRYDQRMLTDRLDGLFQEILT